MERLDDILGYENLKIYQNSDYFSFSLDSVILANYSTIRLRDKRIVDFCTGNGVVPLILSKRCSKNIIGVEIQEPLVELAKKSIQYNKLEERISIECLDIKEFSKNHLNEFDLILCNPPYFKIEEESTFNDSYEKRIARHEILINIDEVLDCAKKSLKDKGNICIVHRSDRLVEILDSFKNHGIEPKRIKFVYETLDKDSTLVLIEGQKCGSVGLKIDKPLILYNSDGTETFEYKRLQEEVVLCFKRVMMILHRYI